MSSQLLSVPLEQILVDPAVHGRACVKQGTVREYARAAGDPEGSNNLPAIDAFHDSDGRLWLADGFLRYYGAYAGGHHTISVCIHAGERRDAILFACGANSQHGVPRSRTDKRATAAALLLAPEHAGLSDREIARQSGISHTFVSAIRPHCDSPENYQAWQTQQEAARRQARFARREAREQAMNAAAEEFEEFEESRQAEPPAPAPSDEPPLLDRPLTTREEAERLLARAAASMLRAKRNLSQIKDEYPESIHFPAVVAMAEARYAIEDLLPEELRTTPADHRHALEVLTRFGIDLDLKVGEGRDEERGMRGEEELTPRQPETLPVSRQPETLPGGGRTGRGSRIEGPQPETLPTRDQLETLPVGRLVSHQPETLPPSGSSRAPRPSPLPTAARSPPDG